MERTTVADCDLLFTAWLTVTGLRHSLCRIHRTAKSNRPILKIRFC